MTRRPIYILLFCIVSLCVVIATDSAAQNPSGPPDTSQYTPSPYKKLFRGRVRIKDDYGDSVWMVMCNDFVVYSPLKFKNKQQEEFYWRTVRDVRKTLPYAKLAFRTLCETYEYIQTIPDQKQREAHLKNLEREIFEQYKPVIKSFTKSQGKMLLKLINRETNQTSYKIVKAFLGSFRAGFWQLFGQFFGMNLKIGYNPKTNEEDAIIERVATEIEQGNL